MVDSPCKRAECGNRSRSECAPGCVELALYQRFLAEGITFESDVRAGVCVICGGVCDGHYCEACRREASVGRANLTAKYPRTGRGGGRAMAARVYTLAEARTSTVCEYCGAKREGSARVMCSRRTAGKVRPTLHACIKCAKGDTARDITIKNRPVKGGIYYTHRAIIEPEV